MGSLDRAFEVGHLGKGYMGARLRDGHLGTNIWRQALGGRAFGNEHMDGSF